MVETIDIHALNLEELDGVVSLYPWYAGARAELCRRMQEMGNMSDTLAAQTGLYLASRRILYDITHAGKDPGHAVRTAAKAAEKPREQKIWVVGGDYFSQSQYNGVRKADDGIFSSFASGSGNASWNEPASAEVEEEFCTETLAAIYREQGYPAEAKKIYSKLSLRYPEKSVYFAALIDELDKN